MTTVEPAVITERYDGTENPSNVYGLYRIVALADGRKLRIQINRVINGPSLAQVDVWTPGGWVLVHEDGASHLLTPRVNPAGPGGRRKRDGLNALAGEMLVVACRVIAGGSAPPPVSDDLVTPSP